MAENRQQRASATDNNKEQDSTARKTAGATSLESSPPSTASDNSPIWAPTLIAQGEHILMDCDDMQQQLDSMPITPEHQVGFSSLPTSCTSSRSHTPAPGSYAARRRASADVQPTYTLGGTHAPYRSLRRGSDTNCGPTPPLTFIPAAGPGVASLDRLFRGAHAEMLGVNSQQSLVARHIPGS